MRRYVERRELVLRPGVDDKDVPKDEMTDLVKALQEERITGEIRKKRRHA